MIHTAAQPSHDWAASDPQTDFAVNANGTLNLLEATRDHAPDATFIFCSTNKVYGDLPNQLPLHRAGAAPGAARRSSLPPRHRHVDVDRRLHALAVRRLEGGRRPARAGVRALLRHADRLLPRRLPDRAQPRRHPAARLSLLPDALHDDRRPVHGVRLRRQAGARQHPLRRPRRGVRGVSSRAPRRRRSTTSAAAARATARCSRRSRSARRSPAASWTGPLGEEQPDRRPPLVDQRSGAVPRATIRGGSITTTCRHPAGDPRPQRRGVARSASARRRAAEAVGRHPRPQRGRFDRADRRGDRRRAERHGRSTTRSSWSTTPAATGPRTRSRELAARWPERALRSARRRRPASATPFGPASTLYTGDAVAIMMADLSDSPGGSRPLLPRARAGLRLRVRLALRARRPDVQDYPRFKLILNRLVNLGIRMLFRHGYNDTTNAFKAYRREVIDQHPAAALQSLQPHRRDAAEGDRPRSRLRRRADLVDQPHARRLEAEVCRRWAAATCSSSSTCCSSTISAAATTGALTRRVGAIAATPSPGFAWRATDSRANRDRSATGERRPSGQCRPQL